jgi:hypothetical protein
MQARHEYFRLYVHFRVKFHVLIFTTSIKHRVTRTRLITAARVYPKALIKNNRKIKARYGFIFYDYYSFLQRTFYQIYILNTSYMFILLYIHPVNTTCRHFFNLYELCALLLLAIVWYNKHTCSGDFFFYLNFLITIIYYCRLLRIYI